LRGRYTLMERVFLLGVHDKMRIGVLRFKTEEDGTFLDDETDCATPPLELLRELQDASWHLEDDDDADARKCFQLLLALGASLVEHVQRRKYASLMVHCG